MLALSVFVGSLLGFFTAKWIKNKGCNPTRLRPPLFADKKKTFYIRDNHKIWDVSKNGKLAIWQPFTDREKLMGMHLVHFAE